jgi:hypothetical protein
MNDIRKTAGSQSGAVNGKDTKGGALRGAFRSGLSSARENAIPGIILWLVATAIVAGYYLYAPMTAALESLGRVKASAGFLYSAISTGIFGGLIPFLWKFAFSRKTQRDPLAARAWQVGLFLSLFWAWKGIEIDLLYRGQSLLFGTGANPGTIIPKVLVDQFVYNPLWAGWTQVVAYWWVEKSFRVSALADSELWGTMGVRVITILISTWGVWIPMVSIIYAMPANLQIPLFDIALCFWSLMLASLTKEKRD